MCNSNIKNVSKMEKMLPSGMFPNLKRKNTLECYLGISVAEDRYPTILIMQRMILGSNF